MRAGESYLLSNAAAGTYSISPNANQAGVLQGGLYEINWVCTIGGGNLAVQKLGPDGSTWIVVPLALDTNAATVAPVVSLTASASTAKFWAEPGQYRIVITTSTANYVSVTRIPTSE